MKRAFLPIVVLIVFLVAGYYVLSIWRGLHLYQSNLSRETLLGAIQLNPSNPDPFYRLALFYEWDFPNADLEKSLHYLRKAIERNPLKQEYWLTLARVFQGMGENRASECALGNAILVFPTGYQGRWTSANTLIEQGAFETALPHFTYVLVNYPEKSSLVYDVLDKVYSDTNFILDRVIPRDPSSINRYIAYLYEIGDEESVKKARQRKASYGFKSNREEVLHYIDFLIAHGELSEAFQIWEARLHEEGLSIPSDGNLVTNGGFEYEKILGSGFDWKIKAVDGAAVSFDQTVAFEGRSSLKIVFNGKENIDFQHVYQFVSLKPDTQYLLKAHMKTKAVTTLSGLKVEVLGIGPPFQASSEILTGDNEWRELVIAFRTPARSQGGLIRVRRAKTDKFDRFISGSVWIDNVRLMERKP
jgi:tetratricopeptide (TPR) repeat protein